MRGERLSLRSSDFWLPWGFVSQDCVEDGEQLSSDGDDRGELVFAGGNELVAEQLEGRVVTCRDHGTHEQSAAHALSPATAPPILADPVMFKLQGRRIAPGEGDSPRVRARRESPSPRPSPRKRGEGEERGFRSRRYHA